MDNLKAFVFSTLKVTENEITSIAKIEDSFTNNVYHLQLKNGNEFKVRIASKNKFINRKLECFIENELNSRSILYYDKNGDFIKKWIPGKILTKENLTNEFWNYIINTISEIQMLDIPNDIEIKTAVFIDESVVIEKSLKNSFYLYSNIVNSFDYNSFVLAHNDVSTANIIVNQKEFTLIDFEWSCLNHKLWDISNLIKDLEMDYEDILNTDVIVNYYNLKKLIEIVFATHFYTYFWTHRMPESEKILNYRKKIENRIEYWYNVINSNLVN